MLPKKKGRKPKSYYENLKLLEMSNNILIISISGGIESICECKDDSILDISKIVVHKKRGRKPKGGIIIEQNKIEIQSDNKPNIILHLNCKLNDIITGDINYDPSLQYKRI